MRHANHTPSNSSQSPAGPVLVARWLLVALLALATQGISTASMCSAVFAQDEAADAEFGEAPAEEEPLTDEATEEESPAAARRSASGSKAPAEEVAEEPALAPITDPAALAILETNPQTPSERIKAILLLIKLDQAAAAKTIVADLLAAKLDDATWSAVVAEFGAGAFIKIGLDEALAPAGQQLTDAALGAADRLARDPARLASFVQDLTAEAEGSRQAAVTQLRRAGAAAVDPLLAVVADPARAKEHAAARSMLILLGGVAHPPLVAALESGNATLQIQAAEVLGLTGASEALPQLISGALVEKNDAGYRAAAQLAIRRLIGPIPNRRAGADYIQRQALDWYLGRKPLDLDGDNLAIVWQWDRDAGQSKPTRLAPAIARTHIAIGLTRKALELDPQFRAAANLLWAALIERDAYRVGLDQPLPTGPNTAHDLLAKLKPDELNSLLSDALKERRPVAAAALATMLGETGRTDLLYSGGPRPAPLVAAAADRDRRVRFAGLQAVVKLRPTRPFAGASDIPRGIEYFIGSLGGRGAVVAAPQAWEASRLAGLLANIGFEPQIATDRQGLFLQASQMSDCQVVLIHVLLGAPGAADALGELRRDPRTAQLPVAIVTPPEHEQRARDIVAHDPLAMVWIRPMNRQGISFEFSELEAQAKRAGVELAPPELRLQQASAALDWLAQLLAARSRLYDFRQVTNAVERALHQPQLAVRAAAVLAQLPSPSAQRALVELASHETSSFETRRAAATAFSDSVARFGSLLTSQQMLAQYDRYNASENQPEANQRLLGSLLDALERGRVPQVATQALDKRTPADAIPP